MQKAGCDNADKQLIQCPGPWSASVELDLLQTCKLNVPKTQCNSFDLFPPCRKVYAHIFAQRCMDICARYICIKFIVSPFVNKLFWLVWTLGSDPFVKGLRLWISKTNFTRDLNARCAIWINIVQWCYPSLWPLGDLQNSGDSPFVGKGLLRCVEFTSNFFEKKTKLPQMIWLPPVWAKSILLQTILPKLHPGALGCQHLVVHWPAKYPPSPMPRKYSP